jgi:hypothetical protein
VGNGYHWQSSRFKESTRSFVSSAEETPGGMHRHTGAREREQKCRKKKRLDTIFFRLQKKSIQRKGTKEISRRFEENGG